MTKTKLKTLRDLIDRARFTGPTTPPIPITEMSKRLGFARQHLYKLMNSEQLPMPHTIAKLERNLTRALRGVVAPRTIARIVRHTVELAEAGS